MTRGNKGSLAEALVVRFAEIGARFLSPVPNGAKYVEVHIGRASEKFMQGKSPA